MKEKVVGFRWDSGGILNTQSLDHEACSQPLCSKCYLATHYSCYKLLGTSYDNLSINGYNKLGGGLMQQFKQELA